MSEPIPVSLALKAAERAIRECDAAPETWHLWCEYHSMNETRFAVLASAGFRGTLEYLRHRVALCGYFLDTADMTAPLHAAVAPFIAHYDRVSPGWRTE